jgi:hypothetical protein
LDAIDSCEPILPASTVHGLAHFDRMPARSYLIPVAHRSCAPEGLKHVTFQPGYSQWGGKMRRLNVDARTVHYLKIRCQELIVRDIFS